MNKIKDTLMQKQIHWGWMLTGGLLAVLGGIIAIGSPFLAGIGISFFVGWMMVATGFYYLLYTIAARREGRLFRKIFMTALYFIAGIAMLNNPLLGLKWLTLMAGVLLFLEGITSLSLLFSREIQSRRSWLAISGVLEIGLGIYVLLGLSTAKLWLVGTFWGVHMVILGINMLSVALSARPTNELASQEPSSLAA